MASSNVIKNRESFGYINFKVVDARLVKFTNLILCMPPTWIGYRYRSPIMWYPPDGYHFDYELAECQEGRAFTMLKKKNGFGIYPKKTYLAYSLTQLHVNHLLA